MSGPSLDLLGPEEMAELTDVLASGHLSRYGPTDDSFAAKARRLRGTSSGTLEDAVRACGQRQHERPATTRTSRGRVLNRFDPLRRASWGR